MIRLLILFFLTGLCSSSAHSSSPDPEKRTLGVEIGQEGQVLMRQERSKKTELEVPHNAEIPQGGLMEHANTEDKPPQHTKQLDREAAEAFARPSKIDDSFFGYQSPRMPAFIERYPWSFATVFVMCALLFLIGICLHVRNEEGKDEEETRVHRSMRILAAAGALRNRMGVSFAPRVGGRPNPEAIRGAAQAAAAAAAHKPSMGFSGASGPMAPSPKAKATRPGMAENGMAALSNAVGNITDILSGENGPSGASKADSMSAHLSAQQPSGRTGSSRSKLPVTPVIGSGTVLRVCTPDVIFASPKSWQEIGELMPGQQVVAAAPPEMVDTKDGVYSMVPIKPRGAVDLKTLEVVREYWQ